MATAPAKGGKSAKTARRVDPHTRAIEDSLREALSARVSISRGRSGGRILISFHDDEELAGIVAAITG
jgi:hypothetical protein